MRFMILGLMLVLAVSGRASAFCGFYVAKADGDLFNQASKVVYMRDKDRSVITMVSDYKGAPSEFAMIVPTPYVLEESQIHVTTNALVNHLDAYTAPRLVEYFDDDPCSPQIMYSMRAVQEDSGIPQSGDKSLGVTVEARYTVGEYDILMLGAEQSDGLAKWLTQNGYKIPDGAERALEQYIKAGMKFFVAKVNLAEHDQIGGGFLRPLQIAFESPHFMLPIRLGMVNASGPQDLLLYTLTRKGRVETVNYRTVKMPTDFEVPLFAADEFDDIYRAGFDAVIKREGGSGVVMEYAWDMNWCDPCAADPLSQEQLVELGAYWLANGRNGGQQNGGLQRIAPGGLARDVFVTRLHARYDDESFPEDLMLRVTEDRENFQGRYIMRHPWTSDAQCEAADEYFASLPDQFEAQAQNLAKFTRWPIGEIREKMKATGQDASAPRPEPRPWWEKIWPKD
ncbi:MAG: DUF2330 domain-containing protein [Pikeienuella sp.]